ncbi:MAG: PAS domain-containing protein [Candidatus Abyssobacteria bacterium SURF_17]|uniref:histidine kinase n=1 Tax=Candidatus Abyssobacteria bacterium SURF_17 TaxID=2093361 RepID=A0A419F8J5_9BACT|nr:MAG: PAS domain-containing protein [Candidatus Abyssubacteria bacterium SURF_17]
MMDPFKTDVEQGRLVLKRFALARAVIVAFVGLACGGLQLKSGATLDLSTAYLYVIFAVALIESCIIILMLWMEHKPTIRFSALLLCADIVLVSGIVVVTGGSKSIFAFLYIAVILSASILLSFNWNLLIATTCSLLFVLGAFLEWKGLIIPASAFRWMEPRMALPDLWAYTGIKVFAFYLTAFLAGYLSRWVGLLQLFQQNVLNSFSSGFISVNHECLVTFLNPAGENLLRRSLSEVEGKPVSFAFPLADGQPNPLEESIRDRREFQSREIAVKRGDGEQIPVGITVSHIKGNGRKILGAVASFVDLSERKRMEEKLRRTDRLAAVGEMSTSLAHEIRNPVASIRGAIQELADNVQFDGVNGRLMQIAVRECDQLSKVVSKFLTFVSPGPSSRQRFAIGQLLDEVVAFAERCCCNGSVTILKQYDADLGFMMGDCSQIKEAVLNVLRNGIESMPGGGMLHVGARIDPGKPTHAVITVQDAGCGLGPDEREKIFDPFYTTKPKGSGLGLAIAHKIVSAHDGSIEVQSIKGRGTAVTIVLPNEI